MKRKILTKKDIQRDLLIQINQKSPLALFLSVLTAISVVGYIVLFLRNFRDHRMVSLFWICGMPMVIMCLAVFVFRWYYMPLYKAKKGKYTIEKQRLIQKGKEHRKYYRHIQKEYTLYFLIGRIAVSEEVYACANKEDCFYTVLLHSEKGVCLAYPAKYYEMKDV